MIWPSSIARSPPTKCVRYPSSRRASAVCPRNKRAVDDRLGCDKPQRRDRVRHGQRDEADREEMIACLQPPRREKLTCVENEKLNRKSREPEYRDEPAYGPGQSAPA